MNCGDYNDTIAYKYLWDTKVINKNAFCIISPERLKCEIKEEQTQVWNGNKCYKFKENTVMNLEKVTVNVDGCTFKPTDIQYTDNCMAEYGILRIECPIPFKPYHIVTPKKPEPKFPEIKKVIFNDPATIVLWSDDTKTVVKCENEKFDPEKGLAMAITKKVLGNNGHYFETIKKHTRDWYVENVKRETENIKSVFGENFLENMKMEIHNMAQLFSTKKEDNDEPESETR